VKVKEECTSFVVGIYMVLAEGVCHMALFTSLDTMRSAQFCYHPLSYRYLFLSNTDAAFELNELIRFLLARGGELLGWYNGTCERFVAPYPGSCRRAVPISRVLSST
jgi:hypothetical protein